MLVLVPSKLLASCLTLTAAVQADRTRQELGEARSALEDMSAHLKGVAARKSNLEAQVRCVWAVLCTAAPHIGRLCICEL